MAQLAKQLIGLTVRAVSDPAPVNRAVKKAHFRNLEHALASIRKTAIQSMARAKGPSPAGSPPHRHRGRLVRSIQFGTDNGVGFVGPAWSRLSGARLPPWVGNIHEFGGAVKHRKGKKRGEVRATYPARPYMAPALQANLGRIANDWRGALASGS